MAASQPVGAQSVDAEPCQAPISLIGWSTHERYETNVATASILALAVLR